MTHDGAFEVRIGVVFAGLMMAVIEPCRRELFQPDLKIVNESVLPVVDVDAGGDVHRRHEHHSFLDGAFLDNGSDFIGDADELLALLGVEPEILGGCFHRTLLPVLMIVLRGKSGISRVRSTEPSCVLRRITRSAPASQASSIRTVVASGRYRCGNHSLTPLVKKPSPAVPSEACMPPSGNSCISENWATSW